MKRRDSMHLKNPSSAGFKERVYRLLLSVPAGRVVTYSGLAKAAGKPGACRAVGRIMFSNPDPERVPCFRVVKADGSLGGYRLGMNEKARRLEREGIRIRGNRIDLKRYLHHFA